jgi:hypothetical protein
MEKRRKRDNANASKLARIFCQKRITGSITSALPKNPGAVSYRRAPACMLHLSTSDSRKQNLEWQTLENMREGEAANDRMANFERNDAR